MSTSSASSTHQEPDPKPERGDDRASPDEGESGGSSFREAFSTVTGWGESPPQKGDDSGDFDPGY